MGMRDSIVEPWKLPDFFEVNGEKLEELVKAKVWPGHIGAEK